MRDEILGMLLNLSDRQLDPEAKRRIREIIGLDDTAAKKPLSNLLDLCVYCSWCSGFEIQVLSTILAPLNVTEAEKAMWRAEMEAAMTKATQPDAPASPTASD